MAKYEFLDKMGKESVRVAKEAKRDRETAKKAIKTTKNSLDALITKSIKERSTKQRIRRLIINLEKYNRAFAVNDIFPDPEEELASHKRRKEYDERLERERERIKKQLQTEIFGKPFSKGYSKYFD